MPAGAKIGIDVSTGQFFYNNGGNWTAVPTAAVDLNTTVSDETGSNGAGATTPASPPTPTPDAGDLHIEIYDDVTIYFTAGAANWTAPARVEIPFGITILPTTSKGDVIVHNGTTNVRLPVGADETMRIPDATAPTGWIDVPRVIRVDTVTDRDNAGPLYSGQIVFVADNGAGVKGAYVVEVGGATFPVATTVPFLEIADDLDMNFFSLVDVLNINSVPADHLKRVSNVVRLTGGVTPLDIDVHANALIILDSGSNTLTWNNANRTFPIKVWNKQGTPADVFGFELAHGARTDVVLDGADIQIVTPELDIRAPVDKATLLTPGSAVNLAKTPHRTQVLVTDLVGGTTPGIVVCIGDGTDPTVPAGAWAELATVTVV